MEKNDKFYLEDSLGSKQTPLIDTANFRIMFCFFFFKVLLKKKKKVLLEEVTLLA